MPLATVPWRFPVGGVVRRSGFQTQEPFTAYDALNVWPDDPDQGRERGGTRPGLASVAGSAASPRCMISVNSAGDESYERELLLVASGTVYRMASGASSFSTQSGSLNTSSGQLFAAQYGQTVYFASYESGTPSYNKLDLSGTSVSAWEASAGTLPADCTLIASWNNRIVLAGDPDNPHTWYMSAQGDPTDFEYGLATSASAVSGTQFEGGVIGEPISAIISHSQKCLLFGTTDGLWIMRGDPQYGGSIEVLSREVGPISGSAWCKTPTDETVMLTRDGLYVMAAGCGSAPKSLSRERLPQELTNVDVSANYVMLAYDVMLRAVHVWITPKSGSTPGAHWLVDWKRGGFWPIQLYSYLLDPTAVCDHTPRGTADLSSVMIGCKNGSVRQFSRNQTGDVGNSFTSYVVAGPFPIAQSIDESAIVAEAYFVGEAIAGDYQCQVFTGDTAEEAATGTRTYTCPDNTHRSYPRIGGQAAAIKISSTESNSQWVSEGGALRVAPTGRMRR